MKKYYVTVNGNRYEVEVEEVKGDFASRTEVAQTKLQSETDLSGAAKSKDNAIQTEKSTEVKRENLASSPIQNFQGDGEKIECPMPGSIVKVNVNSGDTVKKGDVLLVLEAMKMENEIMAPRDGQIVHVAVSKGAAVNTGDTLVVLK